MKAIFFDRDGILNNVIIKNNKPYSPLSLKNFKIKKKLKKKVKILKKEYLLFVVTNQPEVSRGNLKLSILKKQNQLLMNFFKIKRIYVCTHDNSDNCECRKPKTGLFKKAKKENNFQFNESFLIGDRWKDISAGNKLNIKTLFIDYGYNEKRPKKYLKKFKTVYQALNFIINFKYK